jgi:hypothetical protein
MATIDHVTEGNTCANGCFSRSEERGGGQALLYNKSTVNPAPKF